jgi:hypothetical protein
MKRHFQSGDERQEFFLWLMAWFFLRDCHSSAAWKKIPAVHFPNSNHNSFSHEMFKMKRQYLLTWSALGMYAPPYPLPICLWGQGEGFFFFAPCWREAARAKNKKYNHKQGSIRYNPSSAVVIWANTDTPSRDRSTAQQQQHNNR